MKVLNNGMVEVCPGFQVTPNEYLERYGGLNLDYYQQHMTPQLFEAFVRGCGSIRGVGGLRDVSLEDFMDSN